MKGLQHALESTRAAYDALAGELRGCQEELAATRVALASAKDDTAREKDRALGAERELEALRRKVGLWEGAGDWGLACAPRAWGASAWWRGSGWMALGRGASRGAGVACRLCFVWLA